MSQRKVTKKQLGKGVRALLANIDQEVNENPQKVVKELSSSIAELPLSAIRPNPDQPRKDFDDNSLQELATSLRNHGLIQPLTVRRLGPDDYQLISGERRWRASKLAGLEVVPAYVRIAADDNQMLEWALIENIQREDLNAFEIAITYKRLKEECNLTQDELADRVGKKRSTVANYLRLLKLPEQIKLAIKNRKISMGHARELAGLEDIGQQLYFLKEILANNWSVRTLEQKLNQLKNQHPKASGKPSLPTEYEPVLSQLKDFFGTRKIGFKVSKTGSGSITIPFENTDQLNYFLEKLDKGHE